MSFKVTEVKLSLKEDSARKKTTRVYFFVPGQDAITNLLNRCSLGDEAEAKTVEAFKRAGLVDLDGGELNRVKLTWSQQAGCRCGCSPGFVANRVLYNVENQVINEIFVGVVADPAAPLNFDQALEQAKAEPGKTVHYVTDKGQPAAMTLMIGAFIESQHLRTQMLEREIEEQQKIQQHNPPSSAAWQAAHQKLGELVERLTGKPMKDACGR